MKNFTFLFITLFILSGCTSLSDAGKIIRNEKTKTNDEFLIKKKSPLTIPPDFDKLPSPNSKAEKKTNKDINKIFKNMDEEEVTTGASSSESSILKQIKK